MLSNYHFIFGKPNRIKKIPEITNVMKFSRLCSRFPFDWRSPFGYSIALMIEYIVCLYSLKITACLFALGIGCFVYLFAASKCVKGSIEVINESTSEAEVNSRITFERFTEFIQFHSHVKQLSSHRRCVVTRNG